MMQEGTLIDLQFNYYILIASQAGLIGFYMFLNFTLAYKIYETIWFESLADHPQNPKHKFRIHKTTILLIIILLAAQVTAYLNNPKCSITTATGKYKVDCEYALRTIKANQAASSQPYDPTKSPPNPYNASFPP